VPEPFSIDVKAKATMKLLGIGNFEIDATLRIDGDGLAALIEVEIGVGASFGNDIGLGFNVTGYVELNTSAINKTLFPIGGPVEGITLPPGFKMGLSGSVEFLGFVEASGSITITLRQGQFSIEFDVELQLGPLIIAARGGAAIYTDSHPGIALVLDVSVEANLVDVIKIKATGKLQFNTTDVPRMLAGVHMNEMSFKIALTGEVKFLEVLKFDASFVLDIGYEGVGSWKVEFSASLDFFGFARMSAYGMFNYKGHFDISLSGGFTLGTDSFGLKTSFEFRVAFGERQVAGQPAGITEYFFTVSASGSAKLRAFGFTFAGVSIGFSVTAAGSGRVPIIVEAEAELEFLFFSVSVSMSFTLGYIELPRVVYLAGNSTGDPRFWDPIASGGELHLNMGSRNGQRGIADGAANEIYIVEHVGSDSAGEIVRVKFSGREKIYRGVTKIIAEGGDGDDHIYVAEGVTSDVEFHGGAGNDVFIYGGQGTAQIYGDDGFDYIVTEAQTGSLGTFDDDGVQRTAILDGGNGEDYIVHDGHGIARIEGGAGDDKIYGGSFATGDKINGGSGRDEIFGRGGMDDIDGGTGDDVVHLTLEQLNLAQIKGGEGGETDGDVLEVTATPNADTLTISSPGAGHVMIVLGGSVDGTEFEGFTVIALGGSDTVVISSLKGSTVQSVTIDVGAGSMDRVTINGTSQQDQFVVTSSSTGVNTATKWDNDSTTINVDVIKSVRGEGDTLTINTQAGDDSVNALALNNDRLALEIIGGEGHDTLKGSPFNDVIDSGLGNDFVTGGPGFDLFFDNSPEGEMDTLVEAFDQDIGLFNDTFVVGTLLNSQGSQAFAIGKSPANELTDAGDRWANGTIVEDLRNIFERADISGGSGNNTIVVNDLDNSIRVGSQTRLVSSWRGEAKLNNGDNNTAQPEHYLITVRPGDIGNIHVRDSAGSNDRIVITGSSEADWVTISATNVPVYAGDGLLGDIRVSGNRNVNEARITHSGADYIEINTREGDDLFAIRQVFTQTMVNTSTGDDIINVGSNAQIGGASANTGGTLNLITASLTINGQGTIDTDVLNLDDTAETVPNDGTLTSSTLTNGIPGNTGERLLGAGGQIIYGTLEELNLNLGDSGNRLNIKSTHAGASITNIQSGFGADLFNVEKIGGGTTIRTGLGSDLVRVGSTTGSLGQLTGLPEASTSALNDVNGAYIHGRLSLFGDGGFSDELKIYDSGDTSGIPEGGTVRFFEVVGFGMTQGIGYEGFEVFKLWLSDANNNVFIQSTHEGVTFIDTGDEEPVVNGENDVVNIQSTSGSATIDLGGGNDVVRVNYKNDGSQTFLSGIVGELTLHGQEGGDLYEIGLAGEISSRINVFDQSKGDPGIDRLRIFGTNEADFFLIRANQEIGRGMVAAVEVDVNREPVPGGVIERINYDGDINGAIEIYGRSGDDTFVFDDTLAPVVAFGDAGKDTFQVGQVYDSARDGTNPDNGLAEEDYFQTTQITRGFLSNGISQSATMFGGVGNDTFTVYSNKAELFLFGDEDDDTFVVRAFVKVDPNDPKAPYTNINGGQGADFVAYTVNAPVRIDGGDGFDTLTVIGTEFGDDFVINDQGIYGAGLFITYVGLEKIVVDAIEGNDRFFIASTSEKVAIEIVGGLGSDTFNVAGSYGQEVTVVSNDLNGHSGLVIQTVSSSDPEYQAIFVQDVSASVADNDEAGIVVTLVDGPLRVFEEGQTVAGLIRNRYTVVLTRQPEENVQVTAAPVAVRESEQASGGEGIALNGSENGVTLLFTRSNWFIPQTIEVTAPDDVLAEGRRNIAIQHNVIQGSSPKDGGAYDGLAVLGALVEVIDNDTAEVLIVPGNAGPDTIPDTYDTVVAEHPGAAADLRSDFYSVLLTKPPTGNVVVNLAAAGLQINLSTTQLTFTTANWNTPQPVTVSAVNDTAKEATHYARITHTIAPETLTAFLGVTLADVTSGLAREINEDLDQDRSASIQYLAADVTLTGVAREGDIWTLNIRGVDLQPYVVGPGETLANIANALRSRASVVLTAILNGDTIELSSTSLFSVSVSVQGTGIALVGNTEHGTGGADIAPHAGAHSYLVATGPAFELDVNEPYLMAHVALTGMPVAGQNWTLLLNGIPYLYKVQFGDSLEDVAAALATMVESADHFSAIRTEASIQISSTAFFTATFVVSGSATPTGGGAVTGTPALVVYPLGLSTAAWNEATLALSGTPAIGAVWIALLNGQEYRYTVKDISGSPETLAQVAGGLADVINKAGAFQVQYDSANVLLTGSTAKDEVWTLNLNGAAFSYTVQSREDLTHVAAALAGLVDAAAGFTATVSVADARVIQIAGGGFTIKASVAGANVAGGVEITGSTSGSTLTVSSVT
ncbi:MAG TPA: calcium-binding protein, partial [Candidatus Limnocylindria bacterium]|nr:calcium-binding protein [Candidatus Limnocylindria bacterium]